MQKELFKKDLGDEGQVALKVEGLDLVLEIRGKGKAIAEKIKKLIPGDIDDAIINAALELVEEKNA